MIRLFSNERAKALCFMSCVYALNLPNSFIVIICELCREKLYVDRPVHRWCSFITVTSVVVGLTIERSLIQFLAIPFSCNNSVQVIHISVHLSLSVQFGTSQRTVTLRLRR